MRSSWGIIAAAGLLVASCGSGGDGSTQAESVSSEVTDESSSNPDSGDSTAAEPAGDSATDFDRSATLRIVYHGVADQFDPIMEPSPTKVGYFLPVFDTLIQLTPDAQLEPMLAESWGWNDDNSLFSLKLRDGVKFHDGTSFDADAVKMNLDRLLQTPDSPVSAAMANVTAVNVIDPLNVELEMSSADVGLPWWLADRAGMMVSPAALEGEVEIDREPVGTGPYRMTEFLPGDRVTYERFDNYWGGEDVAAAAELVIAGITDGPARFNALQSGQYDIAYVTANQIEEVVNAGFKVEERAPLLYIQMMLNRQDELADVRVRQAIWQAIDREAICEVVYFGHCEPTAQPYAADYWAALPDVGPDYYPYDPDHSRELLAEAGLEDGFEFDFNQVNVDPYAQLAELIQAQLGEVGIKMNIRPVDLSAVNEFFTAKNSDVLAGGGGQQPEPTLLFDLYYRSDGFRNPTGTAPDGLDELIDEMRTTTDQGERGELAREATQIVIDEALHIPLFFPTFAWAHAEGVSEMPVHVLTNMPYVRGVGVLAE